MINKCIKGFLSTMLLAVVYLFYRKSFYYKQYYHYVDKLSNIPDNLRVVNLGSTNAYYAFDFSETDISNSAMNLAGFTQVFAYDLKILKKYKNKVNNQATILITCVYPIFYVPSIPSTRKEVFNQFAKILSKKDMPEWKNIQRFIFLNFPFLLRNNSIKSMMDLEKVAEEKNYFTICELRNKINQKLQSWKTETGIDFVTDLGNDKILNERENKALIKLKELIDFCYAEKWKPIIVVLPYSGLINDKINKEVLQKTFYQNINKLDYDELQIYDYSQDRRFCSREYYMDGEYLNQKGRKLFTEVILKECIK